MILDDSNLFIGQRIKNVGMTIIKVPIYTSGYITEKGLLVGGMCMFPVVGTIEYIGTGKCDKTINTLNAIGNISTMVMNSFLEEEHQLKYTDTFY